MSSAQGRLAAHFGMAFLLLGAVGPASAEYAFPESNRYLATVMGTPPDYRAPVPEKIDVQVRSLPLFAEREIPPVLWSEREFEYSVALQAEPAPLVFVVAGTGARFDSAKNAYLQQVLYGAGMSVVNVSSPTHPDFIATGSHSSVPGVMADDVGDLYAAMQRIRDELADEVQPTGYYLTGYSLGGTQAAFLGQLDETEHAFDFQKVLLLNPAVSLYGSVQRLDRMVLTELPGGAPQLEKMVDDLLSRVAHYLRQEGRESLDSDFLFKLEDALHLSDDQLQVLIGVSFRVSLAGMLFTSDVMTDSRHLVEPGTELGVGTPLLPYFKAGSRWSFSDYLDHHLLPYRAKRGEPLSRDALIEADSLYAIQTYLRRTGRVEVMTNADDLILDDSEVAFLRDVFGKRATIYPTGGHCGNLMYRENVERMLAILRAPAADGSAGAASARIRPAPPPPAPDAVPLPLRRVTPAEAAQIPGFLDESDPLEGLNRRIYRFNAGADRWVLLPLVRGYRFVVPGIARKGIHNVFRTLDEVPTLANSILQLRPRKTAETLARLAVNLTVGVAGLWDAATYFEFPDHQEDFGQTLGVWGVGAGPYVVLPLLGPSSLRDASGMLVDRIPGWIFGIPPWYVTPAGAVDTRDNTPFRYGEIGIPFEYLTVRFLSLERERLLTEERRYR